MRMVMDRARTARGSVDRGIDANSDRYVIQMRDSKSSRKAGGHPPSSAPLLAPLAGELESYARDESKLLDAESGGVGVTAAADRPAADGDDDGPGSPTGTSGLT